MRYKLTGGRRAYSGAMECLRTVKARSDVKQDIIHLSGESQTYMLPPTAIAPWKRAGQICQLHQP